MKTMIVFSDTHGNGKELGSLFTAISEADYVVHLGDGVGDMREIFSSFPDKTYVMKGNCDALPALKEYVLDVDGVRVFMCHGDNYGVKRDLSIIAKAGKERGADLVLYGHTHEARIDVIDGVTLVNPGSLKYPASLGGSYAYITFGKGKAYPVIIGNGE